jgi:hypothetical protein
MVGSGACAVSVEPLALSNAPGWVVTPWASCGLAESEVQPQMVGWWLAWIESLCTPPLTTAGNLQDGPDCTKRRQDGFFLDQSIELPEQSRAKYKWWVNLPLCIAEPDKNKTNN